jgi:phenylacetyl-CoA:acceptor oxidoreductase subunit 2
MSYGPNPWQQTNWDWRAAGNFVCGGAGGGLIVFAALSGAQGLALTVLLLGGMALVGTGLLCVWLELGRPLRALHVFINPRTSWMTREAFAATLLMPVALAAAASLLPGLQWLAAALALAFVYCQSRMLQAAKGIPAWREPLAVPLMVLTGLAEGGGLCLAARAADDSGQLLVTLAGAVVLARAAVWFAYRRRVAMSVAPRALAAIDSAGRVLQFAGSLLPLALLALAASGVLGAAPALVVVAGLLAAATGAWFKYTLVTRAGFNQGFALARLPVRGVRRS